MNVMKAIIFYLSTYNGNTLKIAGSMASVLSAELVSVENVTPGFDISEYDLIGFGSAIHFAEHNIRLQRFAATLPLRGKNVFVFSTRCRPFAGGYHKALKGMLKQLGANLVGEFSCAGFDRTGPWVLIDGYNKNRPNDNDMFRARLFAEKLKRKLHPLVAIAGEPVAERKEGIAYRMLGQNKVAGNKIVFLNTTTCVRCGKCVQICPMNVFRKDVAVLPVDERNCIQCQLCAKTCPTGSIYIRESFANGLRIALRETFSTRLQTGYKGSEDNIPK